MKDEDESYSKQRELRTMVGPSSRDVTEEVVGGEDDTCDEGVFKDVVRNEPIFIAAA